MRLKAIASALPDWRVDNATIAAWSGLSEMMIRDKIGVNSRAYLRHQETGVDLAARAAKLLKAEQPELNWSSVRLVVFVTQNPDYRLPHNAALLQHRLGLSVETASFDINLGCSGYVYALSVARGLMAAEGIEDALLVTCDPYSKIMNRCDRDVIALFGDAATATWLSSLRGGTIGRADFGSDGSGARHLIFKRGGAALPAAHLDGALVQQGSPSDGSLHMNGRAIFNFMMERVPASINACLDRNMMTVDDIDYYVFHQASRFLLETLRDRMGLPQEKVVIDLANSGNTVSSTIPLALEGLMRHGSHRGKTLLLSGFGVGLSWATNIVTFGQE